MSQDTRKDPRAKVLTMTVRYKSATLDEFIEHHSYDVSRGGMFIKTPSPFPPGTLLKFEVKIAADQKVIQGVGRVVWKRDSESGAGDTRPAGMGVKFIKIDDASRKVIDALVESRGDAGSAYEAGGGDAGATPAAVPPSVAKPAAAAAPAAAVETGKPPMARKATMIGLGAINPSNRPSLGTPATPPVDKPQASFFPETKSEADMPPPEDRTVMKQAAELLQDALRETGSSMDAVSSAKYADAPAKAAAKPSESVPPRTQPSEPPAEAKPAPRAESKPAPRAESKPASARPAAAAAQKSERPVARKSAVSTAPPGRRVSVPVEAPVEKSGAGRAVVILIAIAAAAGILFLVNKNNTPAPAPAPASAEPAPPPVASEAPPVPADTTSAAPAESVAPPASASAAPPASASAAPAASASAAPVLAVPPKAVEAPVVPTPKPAPVIQAKPAAKPKPAPSEPTAEKPAAPSEPSVDKPAAPAPTPKPAAPAPKPKPVEPAGDNPY